MAAALHLLFAETTRALTAFAAGRSLTEALDAVPAEHRPGAQSLAFAAVRAHGRCGALLGLLLSRKAPPPAEALLRAALAQLLEGQEAAHTVVNQAVQAARQVAAPQAAMVNAVLRRFLREREALLAQAMQSPEALHEHPAWWVKRLKQDWPADWQALLTAAQQPPPFTLRVNAQQGSLGDYLQRLAAAGLAARPLGAAWPQGLVVEPPCPVAALPGFAEGAVSVQDGAAQLAAPLLLNGGPALPPGARVLDACAAPGGKTAHLLELRPDLDLLALDSDATRLRRVDDTLRRLKLRAELKAADARDTAAWWDGRPFDAILLDAPCSASGIDRRHPDVRWLRRASDMAQLTQIQAQLLDALWPLLKPGGRLLYATCSLFAAEGREQAAAFAQRVPTAQTLPLPAAPGAHQGHLLGLPDNGAAVSGDGFFYALFCR